MQNSVDSETDLMSGHPLLGSSATQVSNCNDEPNSLSHMLEYFLQSAFSWQETTEQEQEWRKVAEDLFPQNETAELENSGNHGRWEEKAFKLPSNTNIHLQKYALTYYLEAKSLNYHRTNGKVSSEYSLHGSGFEKREKGHECETSKKRFHFGSDLKKHKRDHTGERPYECDTCKKRFSRRNDLKKHEFVHTGEKPYECELCKESFNQKSSLKRHVFTHTGEKPFECEICHKQFTRMHHLTRHGRVHKEELP